MGIFKFSPMVIERYDIYLRFCNRKKLLTDKLSEYNQICDKNNINFESIRQIIIDKIGDFDIKSKYIYEKIYGSLMNNFGLALTNFFELEFLNYIEEVNGTIIDEYNVFFASYYLKEKYNFYEQSVKIITSIFTEICEYHKSLKTDVTNKINTILEDTINEEFFKKYTTSQNNITTIKDIIKPIVFEKLKGQFYQNSFKIEFINGEFTYSKTPNIKSINFTKNININNYINDTIEFFLKKETNVLHFNYYHKQKKETEINHCRQFQSQCGNSFLKIINLQKEHKFVYIVNFPQELVLEKYFEKARFNMNTGYYCTVENFIDFINNYFTNVCSMFTVDKIMKIFCQKDKLVTNIDICDFSENTLPKQYVLKKIKKYYTKKAFYEM